MGMGGNGNKNLVTGREWELNLRHHGNGIGNGNELMGMGGNGNVSSHSRTSLTPIVHDDKVKQRGAPWRMRRKF